MEQTQKTDVIVTKGVTKVYEADGIPVNALNGIDLTIRTGEFYSTRGTFWFRQNNLPQYHFWLGRAHRRESVVGR